MVCTRSCCFMRKELLTLVPPPSDAVAAFLALVMRLHSTLWAFQSACWCFFEQYPRVLHDAQSLVAFSPHDGSPHSTVDVPAIALNRLLESVYRVVSFSGSVPSWTGAANTQAPTETIAWGKGRQRP
jgi:hypothetical protein